MKIARKCHILAASLLVAAVVFAASSPVGRWKLTADTPDGLQPFVLVVKEADGKLTATFEGSEAFQIKETRFENDTLTLTLDVNGAVYTVTLKVDGDKMEGTWKGEDNGGKVSGTRAES